MAENGRVNGSSVRAYEDLAVLLSESAELVRQGKRDHPTLYRTLEAFLQFMEHPSNVQLGSMQKQQPGISPSVSNIFGKMKNFGFGLDETPRTTTEQKAATSRKNADRLRADIQEANNSSNRSFFSFPSIPGFTEDVKQEPSSSPKDEKATDINKSEFQRPANPKSALIANGWIEQQRRSKMSTRWKDVLASLVEGRKPGEETTLWIQRQVINPQTNQAELEALHQIPIKWLEDITYIDHSPDNKFTLKVYNLPEEFVFRCPKDPTAAKNWVVTLKAAKDERRKLKARNGSLPESHTPPNQPAKSASPGDPPVSYLSSGDEETGDSEKLNRRREAKAPARPVNTSQHSLDEDEKKTTEVQNKKEAQQGSQHLPIRELRAIAHGAGIQTAGMERSELELVVGRIMGSQQSSRSVAKGDVPKRRSSNDKGNDAGKARSEKSPAARRKSAGVERRSATEEEQRHKAAAEEERRKAAAEEERRKAASPTSDEDGRKAAAAEEERRKAAAAEEERRKAAAAEEERRKAAAAEEERRKAAAAEEERRKAATAEEERRKVAAAAATEEERRRPADPPTAEEERRRADAVVAGEERQADEPNRSREEEEKERKRKEEEEEHRRRIAERVRLQQEAERRKREEEERIRLEHERREREEAEHRQRMAEIQERERQEQIRKQQEEYARQQRAWQEQQAEAARMQRLREEHDARVREEELRKRRQAEQWAQAKNAQQPQWNAQAQQNHPQHPGAPPPPYPNQQHAYQQQFPYPHQGYPQQPQQQQQYHPYYQQQPPQQPPQQRAPPGGMPNPPPPQPTPPSSANQKYAKMANSSDDAPSIHQIKHGVLVHWALQPPMLQALKPVEALITTIQTVFPPSFGVPAHEHFKKWKAVQFEDVSTGPPSNRVDGDKLNKIVRKLRLVLHPDKLPKEFTAEQSFVTKLLWDIVNDAFEEFKKKEEDLGWIRS